MDSIRLADNEWRDDNLGSMEDWHPEFSRIAPRLRALVGEFAVLMAEYKEYLLEDPARGSFNGYRDHATEEVEVWMYNKMAETSAKIWEGEVQVGGADEILSVHSK
jgi:hypothetical protein